jgi:SAM-dependent methyltransferase
MNYTPENFAALFGTTAGELPETCRMFATERDFSYDLPDAKTRDAIMLQVLRHIDSDKTTRVGPQREDMWERCWAENLENFVGSEYELETLVPKFIKPGQPVRLNQTYVLPRNPAFELAFFQVCRAFYFDKYLRATESVYEFGCGTGFNLVALGQQLPGIKLYGLDWSPSACEMVSLIGQKHRLDIKGSQFDFYNPDRAITLGRRSAAMTLSALEQVGPRHGAFLDFLLEKKPDICINMEPIEDFYDENNLADYLALMYHRKRGYLSGFLPRLKSLEADGKVKIFEAKRMFFGSLYHEGYSFVVWRPV